ncbi:zinc finger protein 93-like isoform X2 [Anopheles funestus]
MRQNALCRVCASTDAALDLVDIFDGYENEECVADILLELAGIKATVDDGFPRNCCTQCHADLTSAVAMRRKCIESDKLIQATLDSSCPFYDDQTDDVSMASSKQEQTPMYHCSECSIDFYNPQSLEEHFQSKHENAIYGWKSFGITEISLFDTSDDEMVETEDTIPKNKSVEVSHRCCGCLLLFDTILELKQHCKTVHEPNAVEVNEHKPYRCEICYRTFTAKQGVIAHKLKRCNMSYQCTFCGVLYGSRFELQYHEDRHKNHTIPCDVCGRKFYKVSHLNRHKESLHVAPELQKKHICNICGASVRSATYLKVHIQLHSEEQPFSCKVCGARFKLYRYLKWHMVIHKGLHKCEECNAAFKSPSELEDHMNCHIKSMEFNCNLCGGTYYSKQNHRKHMRKVHGQFKRRKLTIKSKPQRTCNYETFRR